MWIMKLNQTAAEQPRSNLRWTASLTLFPICSRAVVMTMMNVSENVIQLETISILLKNATMISILVWRTSAHQKMELAKSCAILGPVHTTSLWKTLEESTINRIKKFLVSANDRNTTLWFQIYQKQKLIRTKFCYFSIIQV